MKTSELTGLALRWAVAKAEELDVCIPAYADTPWLQIRCDGNVFMCPNWEENWTHGGPIIERELISVWLAMDDIFKKDTWAASYSFMDGDRVCEPEQEYWGPTPLIAAMRCYVASKLGEEVEIPEELKGE